MSDLTRFRDHARTMATAEHKPECPSLGPPSRAIWEPLYLAGDNMPYGLAYRGHTPPPPPCDGCNSAEDRELFKALADEVDEYLAQPTEAVDLFGEVTPEPDMGAIYAEEIT